MKVDVKKVLGIVLPIVGAGLSLATAWVDDKKLDDKLTEKVAQALEAQTKES